MTAASKRKAQWPPSSKIIGNDIDTLGLALWGTLHMRVHLLNADGPAPDDVIHFWLTACLDYWYLHNRPTVGVWSAVIQFGKSKKAVYRVR